MPTVVLAAHDEAGHDLIDVRVSIDGAPRLKRLDGLSLAVDPGAHTLRFERVGDTPREIRVVIREGEKGRIIEAALKKAPVPPAPFTPTPSPSRRQVNWLAITVTGAATASLGGFAYLGTSAERDVRDLRDTCAPNCLEEDVQRAERKALAANVLLGTGLAAAGGAVYLWLAHPREGSTAQTLSVVPADGGLTAIVSGRF